MEKCTKFFTMLCDGVSGSELLGVVMVAALIGLLAYVQLKETGSAKNLDFSWLFLDDKTKKPSRSGFLILLGAAVGTWVIIDAEQSGHLDWSFFGVFLSYCAGVRAVEKFAPKDKDEDPRPPDSDYLKDYRHERTSVDRPDCPPGGPVRPGAPRQAGE